MRIRRAVVGLAMAAAVVGVPNRVVALSCVPTPLLKEILAAGGVFEATITARRRLERPVPAGLPEGVPPPPIIGADTFELSLGDVVALRGLSAATLRTSFDDLRPGKRYVFIASRRTNGALGVGGCSGRTFDASRAAGLKAWIASLSRPADGGSIFGAVLARTWGGDVADWPPIEGARVTARGPIVAEATTSANGEYALTGLPQGKYALSVALPSESTKLDRFAPDEAMVTGDHAAVSADFFANVTGSLAGRVVDEKGAPVARQTLYLYSAAGDDGRFGLLTTDAEGHYVADSVAPGRYVLTVQDPFEPAYVPAPSGGTEIVMGWGERVDLPTVVVRRGEPIDVQVFTVDANGRPMDDEVQFQLLGPQGRPLRSGHYVETSRSGQFPQKLMRGVWYRFTGITPDGTVVAVDRVIDGTPIRIVLPR